MAQLFENRETEALWAKIFSGEKDKLQEKMDEFKTLVSETDKLVAEVEGESLEEVRSKLREEFKKQLYAK